MKIQENALAVIALAGAVLLALLVGHLMRCPYAVFEASHALPFFVIRPESEWGQGCPGEKAASTAAFGVSG